MERIVTTRTVPTGRIDQKRQPWIRQRDIRRWQERRTKTATQREVSGRLWYLNLKAA